MTEADAAYQQGYSRGEEAQQDRVELAHIERDRMAERLAEAEATLMKHAIANSRLQRMLVDLRTAFTGGTSWTEQETQETFTEICGASE